MKYSDPLGLVVNGTFNRTTGSLTLTDPSTGTTVTTSAFSGYPNQYSAAPNGTYSISHFPWLSPNYFALVHHDGTIDDFVDGTPSNYDPNQTMSNIRLHPGQTSHACVTVPVSSGSNQWQQINNLLNGTTLGTPINIGGTNYPNYGTLTITGTGHGSFPPRNGGSSSSTINIPVPQINIPVPQINIQLPSP